MDHRAMFPIHRELRRVETNNQEQAVYPRWLSQAAESSAPAGSIFPLFITPNFLATCLQLRRYFLNLPEFSKTPQAFQVILPVHT